MQSYNLIFGDSKMKKKDLKILLLMPRHEKMAHMLYLFKKGLKEL